MAEIATTAGGWLIRATGRHEGGVALPKTLAAPSSPCGLRRNLTLDRLRKDDPGRARRGIARTTARRH